jgi:hypothetical protein
MSEQPANTAAQPEDRFTALEKRLDELIEQTREVFTFDQARRFLNISASQLYKLTCKRKIASYKPGGKLLYFLRRDLLNWITSRPKFTAKQLQAAALNHLTG